MLARDLGMTVGELGARMGYREFVSWIRFYAEEADSGRRAAHSGRAADLAQRAIAARKRRGL